MKYRRGSVVLAVVCCTLHFASCGQYLYYTSKGGVPQAEKEGLYGSAADHTKGSAALQAPDSGYQCVDGEVVKHGHLPIRSMSFDRKNHRVLMKLDENGRLLTVLKADVCQPEVTEPCENVTNPATFLFERAQIDHTIGPFAYDKGDIYFLYGFLDSSQDNYKLSVEMRMFEGCVDKYPVSAWASFYVNDCSKLIATLAQDEYDRFPGVKIGGHLVVIGDSSEKYFLAQVSHVTYNEQGHRTDTFTMELMAIRASNGAVTSLYNATISSKFLMFDMYHLGGVSVRGNTLCWSAVDSVLCADWRNGGKIKNVRVVVPSGNATLACENTPGDGFTDEVVTGVAVAKELPDLAVYFGCVAEVAGSGGAGLVRMTGNDRSIFKLRTPNGTVYAGSMFLVDSCYPDQGLVGGAERSKRHLTAIALIMIVIFSMLFS